MNFKKIVSIIILVIGIIFLNINKLNSKKEVNIIDNNLKSLSSINYIEKDYFMYINIPKINLDRELYPLNSNKNNVKYNIEILKESDMPDVENGNLILAAHSGNGKTAYFTDLKELVLNDKIYIYYNNEKYTYRVVDIYEIEKTGKANIKRNINSNTLTLITCSTVNKTKQIVIISELI